MQGTLKFLFLNQHNESFVCYLLYEVLIISLLAVSSAIRGVFCVILEILFPL